MNEQTSKFDRAVIETTENRFLQLAMTVNAPNCVEKVHTSVYKLQKPIPLSVATMERRFLVARRGRGHVT